MILRKSRFAAVLGVLLLMCAGCIWVEGVEINASNYPCRVNVTVRDASSSAPIGGASVRITDNFEHVVGNGMTNDKGEISILCGPFNDSGMYTRVAFWPFSPKLPKRYKYLTIFAEKNSARNSVKVNIKDIEKSKQADADQVLQQSGFSGGLLYETKIEMAIR